MTWKREVDVPHTCPFIDGIQRALGEFDGDLEQVRSLNGDLRDIAEKYAAEANDLEDEVEYLKERVKELVARNSFLEILLASYQHREEVA